jgi:hypothetical protein
LSPWPKQPSLFASIPITDAHFGGGEGTLQLRELNCLLLERKNAVGAGRLGATPSVILLFDKDS